MTELTQSKQKLADIKVVKIAKKRELESLKEKLAAERISLSPSKMKLDKIGSSMKRLKTEIEIELPKLQKNIEIEIRKKAEAERQLPGQIQEQKAIIKKLKNESAALLKILNQGVEINTKIFDLNYKCSQLEKKTKTLDRKNCSGGFRSLSTLRDVLKNEIAGQGRRLVFWPKMFRL